MELKNKSLICLYGASGTRKTSFIASLPEDSKIEIHDFDNKLEPLQRHMPTKLQKNTEVFQYDTSDNSQATRTFGTFKTQWQASLNNKDVDFVILDSLSSFDTMALQHFCRLSGKDSPTLPIYGMQSGYYTTWLMQLRGITDKTIIILAHDQYIVDDDSGSHRIQPLITGKAILNRLPQSFNELWYAECKGGKYFLYWAKHPKAVCSTTSLLVNADNYRLEDPVWETLQDLRSNNNEE